MKQIGTLVRMRRLIEAAKEVGPLFDKDPELAARRASDLRDVAHRYRCDCVSLLTVLRERGYTPFQHVLSDAVGVFDRTIESLSKVLK